MEQSFALTSVYINRNFQLEAGLHIKDSVHGTVKYCSTLIYNWVKKKFVSLELDERIRSGSKRRFDQQVDIIYNLSEMYFCLNAEHSDSEVPGRSWITEAEIIGVKDELRLGVRVSYTTPRDSDLPRPQFGIPRFVNDISKKVGLIDARRIEPSTRIVDSEEAVYKLYKLLKSDDRKLPIVIIAEKTRTDDIGGDYVSGYLVDAEALAKRIGIIAHIYKIDVDRIPIWNSLVGYDFRLQEGAIRTYNARFDETSDSIIRHPFVTYTKIMAASLEDEKGVTHTAGEAYLSILSQRIIASSLHERIDWTSLGHKFFFMANREQLRRKELSVVGEIEQRELDREYIAELEKKIDGLENELLTAWSESEEKDKQIDEEKRTSYSLQLRLNSVLDQLKQRGESEVIPIPETYGEMEDWVDKYYSGKIVLHSRAKRSIKDASFADVRLVYECIKLLGEDYVSVRKGDIPREDFDRKCAELGIEDCPSISDNRAGELGDTYFVEYRGDKKKLDRHMKKGNVTRDPEKCMRIYYFWDDENEKVVIGSLPQHLQIRTS